MPDPGEPFEPEDSLDNTLRAYAEAKNEDDLGQALRSYLDAVDEYIDSIRASEEDEISLQMIHLNAEIDAALREAAGE